MAAERRTGLRLLAPAAAWGAASLLTLLLAGAVFLPLWEGERLVAALLAAPFALLIIAGYAGYRRSSGLTRLRAAADWVAEQEMAAERRRLASARRRQAVGGASAGAVRALSPGRRTA